MSRIIGICLGFPEPEHREKIVQAAERLGFEARFPAFPPVEEDAALLAECEIVFGGSPAVLEKTSEKLKWFCCPSAGVDTYCARPELFRNPECIFTNSSGSYGVTIAEHTVMVTLMLKRRMPELQAGTAQHQWPAPLPIGSIIGSEFTFLGTGNLGSTIAGRFKALGASGIIGISRSGKSRDPVYDEMFPIARLDEVLPRTETLIMSLPSTEDTRHILNACTLALLPKNALVVNVGRGTAIDPAALREALNTGAIAGAALDVTEPEPLPADDPLWEAKNLLITPHVAGNMTLKYTRDLAVENFCRNLERYAAGAPMEHVVDRTRGY